MLVLGLALAGCSTGGTVGGTAKAAPGNVSGTMTPSRGAASTAPSVASGQQGSPTATPPPDTTVSQADAAAALKAYQSANNAANAGLDTAAMAKIESGSQLALDQATLVYDQGIGGDRAKQAKVPTTYTNTVFYRVPATTYPRGFFVTTDAVASGVSNSSYLLHFTQDQAGAPWLVDITVALGSGRQWPAFAAGPDGLLDYHGTQQNNLLLAPADLAAADRTMLADDNAGQPGSPFLSDDPTTAEQRWIQGMTEDVSPATAALTVTTAPTPPPTYLPLQDGGELVLYGTRLSMRISQSGRTFTFGDQGWAKVAGTDSFSDGYTADSLWTVAAIDPPDKAAKVQKIAQYGGLVAVH
ncbi:hypothetical protein KGQ19_34810 [Catenulispora sp. NL8]|uniref:DUF8094 domain-containing protein n=1 Tax=Catenulispora pinistramenti TaxID=2705254 RepID=A0ABS5L146_9ACTN|nr:hypothetical protein [Catenulispora pinistramenti]MBS2552048.1 hypothetical protein [Catenulispora pinistramenti]